MFIQCLAVGAGGFVGSVCRYLISLIPQLSKTILPLQTLLVNAVGAVLIGVLVQYFAGHGETSRTLVMFLKVGLCGGFTTFSTFSLESAELLHSGNYAAAGLYGALSLILCVGGVFLGQYLMR